MNASSLFQSSPALADGRYDEDMKLKPLSERFNPRPPSRTGATTLAWPPGTSSEFQSSPALADGRYLIDWILFLPSRSFNPRPPSRTGATG